MADPTDLVSTLLPLFIGKKTTTTNSVPGNVTADFNAIMQALLPNVQNSAVTQQDLDALLASVMAKGQKAFAPNLALQGAAGGYNSTGAEALKNDAMAKATNEAVQAMLNAKLQGQQQQLQAGQIAGNIASQQGQLTSSQQQVTPPGLGNLAGPVGAYSLYKLFADDKAKAAGKAGEAAQAAAASSANVGQLDSLLTNPISNPDIVDATSLFKSAAEPVQAITAANTGLTSGFGEVGSTIDDIFSVGAPSLFSNTGAAASVANTASGLGSVGEGFDLLAGATNAAGAASDFGSLGNLFSSGLDAVSDAVGAINSFTSPGGVPFLAGLNNFMEGDYREGAGDIAATMALAAIPVVGPFLALASGFTSNGVLDDWLGIENCYITTATMAATGNTDDSGYELTTMRKFRDGFMKATPAGQELIQDYYDKAPAVVAAINARPDAKQVYGDIYHNYLKPAIAAIEEGDNYGALTIYRRMSQAAERFAYMPTTVGA